jgi:putative ABC transport system permease protein
MWTHDLIVVLRSARRRTLYTAINVAGLAVGLAACILIGLYVRHELGYDDFHPASERIVRVVEHVETGERSRSRLTHSARLAPALNRAFPGVEQAVRISQRWGEGILVQRGENAFYEDRFFFADSAFFGVFGGFELQRGDPATALAEPFSVVLTEQTARKYFGEANPIGETIQAKGYNQIHDLTVTGVADNPPSTSHFQFDVLVSFSTLRPTMPRAQALDSWRYAAHYTYALLEAGARAGALEQALPAFVRERSGESAVPQDVRHTFDLQPITDIHLHSDYDRELSANSDIRYVYIFGTLALLILAVACINYVNLATAQAAQRAREVGVRKTVGAHQRQLARQFLGESALLCTVALGVGLLLARLALPVFNDLTGLSLDARVFDAQTLLLVLAGGAGVALVAGAYPAFYLSAFRPVQVITGRVQAGPAGSRFRKGLVVVQFAVAAALIASTLLIRQQLQHMQTKRLGLNEERVVSVHARHALFGRYDAFKQQLLQQAGVDGVTATSVQLPTTRSIDMSLAPEGVDWEAWTRETDVTINMMQVDEDFRSVMEIPLVAGRDLTEATRSDEHQPVLINETAARVLGWDDPIGKTFQGFRPAPRVVGVVEDFHYQTLRQRIQPLVIMENTYAPRYVMARVQPGDLSGTLDALQAQWAKVSDAPFAYTFMDRRFDQVYRAERRMASAFQVFAGLAVLIACLGLFGLATYAAQRRTREIGIRKALGASVASIVRLLSKDVLALIVLACGVAVPVAYLAMERWLQDFAYRIDVNAWVFVTASAIAVGIALLTVSYQAIQAARTDPVDALRTE